MLEERHTYNAPIFSFPLERSSADFHDKEQLYQIQDDFETSPCIYNRKVVAMWLLPLFTYVFIIFLLGAA